MSGTEWETAAIRGDLERERRRVTDLRARADRIYQEHGNFGVAALARDFLRRYGDLIE
jgi:hypothetical protein